MTTFSAHFLAGSGGNAQVNVNTYDLGGEVPRVRWHIENLKLASVNTLTTNAYQMSFGMATIDTAVTDIRQTMVGWRNEDAISAGDMDGIGTDDFTGGLLDHLANTTRYMFKVTSAQADTIAATGSFSRDLDYPFSSVAITGSLTAHTAILDVLANSVGNSVLASLGFQPDLIVTYFPFANTANVNSEAYDDSRGYTLGYYDVRSSHGRYLNHHYQNAGPDGTNHFISSIMRQGQLSGIALDWEIRSVSDAGFYVHCSASSASLVTATHNRPVFTAIKFDDPTIYFSLVDYTLPLSSATETLSLGFTPKMVHWFGSTVQSIGYLHQNATPGISESYTMGMWSEARTPSAHWGWERQAVNQTDARAGHYHGRIAEFRAGTSPTEIANVRSVTISGTTELQFYSDVLSTTGQGLFSTLLVLGVGTLNSGAFGSPFRHFPNTSVRFFPKPSSEIRDFPK